MKKITILGATGSIGIGALDVVAKNPKKFKVVSLTAGGNIKELARATKFRAFAAILAEEEPHLKHVADLVAELKGVLEAANGNNPSPTPNHPTSL